MPPPHSRRCASSLRTADASVPYSVDDRTQFELAGQSLQVGRPRRAEGESPETSSQLIYQVGREDLAAERECTDLSGDDDGPAVEVIVVPDRLVLVARLPVNAGKRASRS